MPLYRYVASETASDSSTSSSENEPFSDEEDTRHDFASRGGPLTGPSTATRPRLPDAPRVGHSQLRYHNLPHITQPYPVTSRKTLRLRAAILDVILALLGIVAELNEDNASGVYRVRHAKRHQKRVRRGRRFQVKKSHANDQACSACGAERSQYGNRQPRSGHRRCLKSDMPSVRAELDSVARENRFQRAQWETSTTSFAAIAELPLAAAVSTSAPAKQVDVVLSSPAVIACRVAAFALVDCDNFNHTLDLSSLPRLPEAVDWSGLFAAFGSSTATVYHINASGGSFDHWPDWQPWPFPTLRSIDLPETNLKSLPLRITWLPISARLPQGLKPNDNSRMYREVQESCQPNSTYLRLREPPVSRAHRGADRPNTHRLGPLSLLDIVTEMIISRKSLFSEALADLDPGSCSAFDVVSRGYVCCACRALCRPDVRGTAARWIEGEYGLVLHADMEDHIAPGLPAYDIDLRGRLCSECREDEAGLVGPLPPRVSDQIEMPCKQQT